MTPGELPAGCRFRFFGWRQSIHREIDLFEIGLHGEQEVVRLRDVIAELVAPGIQALRAIDYTERCSCVWLEGCLHECRLPAGVDGQRLAIDLDHKAVVD